MYKYIYTTHIHTNIYIYIYICTYTHNVYIYICNGEICNHHRNSLDKEPCHRSLDRETQRDTLDRTREELHSLCKYYNKLLLYLFKPKVHIISFISFHGILSLDYPYIIATSGYIN